jgi:thiosulfate/3-mercaptopyruvate sulfurtransferase
MGARTGLMGVDELAGRLDRAVPGLAVLDMRQRRDDGLGAIPGSAWVDLHDGFAQRRPDRGLNYDLPQAAEVAATLGRLGIAPNTEVVLADDMGNRWATRAYWVLRYYRHPGKVSVLDGGLAAWRARGLATTEAFVQRPPTEYPVPASPDASILATAEQLRDAVTAGTALACDVRTPEEYTGEVALSGRGGHVPGAAHVLWEACLAPDRTFLPDEALRTVLQPFLDASREPITYCQGGIRASLTWFCLHELLQTRARLYAASWEEWGPRHDMPVDKSVRSNRG